MPGATDRGGLPGEVEELFDSQAANWSGKYASDSVFAARLNLFRRVLDRYVPPGGHVLDLGCGTGEIARSAAAAGLSVTGCDVSEKMLSTAISKDAAGAVEWVRLDSRWQRLPFAEGSFTAVVASSVLEYVAEPAAVLAECARVLRPGGLAACTVPDLRHPVRWLEALLSVGARMPAAAMAGRHWPWLGSYLTFLRTSRQRRTVSWWRAAAGRAGLRALPYPGDMTRKSRLRLLIFIRPEETEQGSQAAPRQLS